VTIGEGSVVGARSVVAEDVPPYAVVAGNPARVIRQIERG
jgi:acetyltransferase-like isoleucine patch superfamily enzyme